MDITVIICTHNRCQNLARTLESVAASKLGESISWEVLVVDNNSSDQTREVVEGYCRQYPGRFRYVFEPRQGKSHALNAGVQASVGKILAFTDDDVTVAADWLQNLTAALYSRQWAGAGGRILPLWCCSPPSWLPLKERRVLIPLGVFDLGTESGPLTETPFGANGAFRREMFEKYGGFRTDLGPQPNTRNPQKSEDSEFGHRLLAAGERLRYEPSAVVYHPVPESRLQSDYFLSWWFDKARADVRAFGIFTNTKLRVGGIPLSFFRRFTRWTLQWMITTNRPNRFMCKLNVWCIAGQILQCHRQPPRPKDKTGRSIENRRAELRRATRREAR
jgi:glucosyl-dolichyl phosphate glucuronosyltransferase